MEDSKKTDQPTPDDDPAAAAKQMERERLMTLYKMPSKMTVEEEDKRGTGTAISREDRIAALVEEAKNRAPPAVAEYIKMAGPIIVPVVNILISIFNVVGPLYVKLAMWIYTFLNWLPWDLFQATLGLGLCFFGGGYCASIAACEAFAMTGWPVTRRHLVDVYEAAIAMDAAQKADDEKDDDGDGVADVKQIPTSQLIDRKIRVAANAVQDPQKLAAAVGGLYTGWLAVQGGAPTRAPNPDPDPKPARGVPRPPPLLTPFVSRAPSARPLTCLLPRRHVAVLRIKFAKTINLAISCSQFFEYYAVKLALPFLTPFVGVEFIHWLPTGVNMACRSFFVYLAWKLQEVVSAAQSGLRGGLMFSRGLLRWMNKHGFKTFLGFSLEEEHTYVDEVFGYAVAALGFYVQWNLGFGMPFPLNYAMLPLDVVEWYIRYTISSGPAAGAA